MSKYHQGQFKPNHPEKYRGDSTQIFYRSSYELKLMLRFDNDKNIIEWNSEETVIPYISPIDGKYHRYFVDFRVKTSTGDTILIEVKPASKLKQPVKPKKVTKRFLKEVMEWGVNDAKFKAAKEYCADRNWKFIIFTEKELGISS
jgi:hypothetical protein